MSLQKEDLFISNSTFLRSLCAVLSPVAFYRCFWRPNASKTSSKRWLCVQELDYSPFTYIMGFEDISYYSERYPTFSKLNQREREWFVPTTTTMMTKENIFKHLIMTLWRVTGNKKSHEAAPWAQNATLAEKGRWVEFFWYHNLVSSAPEKILVIWKLKPSTTAPRTNDSVSQLILCIFCWLLLSHAAFLLCKACFGLTFW